MIIKDILNLDKRKVDLYNFSQRKDLFEIETTIDYYMDNNYVNNENRFEVFEIFNEMSDSRRGIWFYSAYFDNEPIALWYEAGREGDDSKKGYILNKTKFIECIRYLESFKEQDIKEININDDIQELDYIYGYDISKLLFNHNFDLKYKIDDIVILEQVEDIYPEIKDKNIFCKIIKTDNQSSAFTYQLELIDYKQIPYFDLKNTRNISHKIFKITDVLHYNEMMSEEKSYNDLNESQLKVINDFLFDKISLPKITLAYYEENLIKSI